jgi:Predicted Zn peptidase
MKNEKLIGYNQNHPPVRIRFSVAHEIGHIRLAHPDGVFDNDAAKIKNYETEADVFAGEFLVPLDTLKTAFKKCRDYNQLAKHFNVSSTVMYIRFKDSRLLDSIF